MIGTFVNVIAIIAGGALGLFLNNRLPDRFITIFFQVIGIFTLFLGMSMALETTHVLHMIIALILGALVGEALQLQKGAEHISSFLKSKLKIGNEKFTEGLLTAFLLYCMGSLTILGAIEEGMGGSPKLLYIKSLMDGVSSIALASGLGVGVLFSVVPLFIYQGGITLFASWFGDFFPTIMITEMSAVGGILLIGMSLNILNIKKINVMNMLPSLIMIIILLWLFPEISI
ncbi:MAG: DUF554 domain-containing protein [Bacteroidetes bacterium]|nr:DUF554 domain-containing protein [Bacteroidota bacterium]MBL6943738.1 DUF554 domain-containing protein [Bacteroidales bacterium]